MINIPQDKIPLLETNGIFEGECVAFGIMQEGIVIHFIEKDECILAEWEDIICNVRKTLQSEIMQKNNQPKDIEEIKAPTKDGD